jgi:hypothetical protein
VHIVLQAHREQQRKPFSSGLVFLNCSPILEKRVPFVHIFIVFFWLFAFAAVGLMAARAFLFFPSLLYAEVVYPIPFYVRQYAINVTNGVTTVTRAHHSCRTFGASNCFH